MTWLYRGPPPKLPDREPDRHALGDWTPVRILLTVLLAIALSPLALFVGLGLLLAALRIVGG